MSDSHDFVWVYVVWRARHDAIKKCGRDADLGRSGLRRKQDNGQPNKSDQRTATKVALQTLRW